MSIPTGTTPVDRLWVLKLQFESVIGRKKNAWSMRFPVGVSKLRAATNSTTDGALVNLDATPPDCSQIVEAAQGMMGRGVIMNYATIFNIGETPVKGSFPISGMPVSPTALASGDAPSIRGINKPGDQYTFRLISSNNGRSVVRAFPGIRDTFIVDNEPTIDVSAYDKDTYTFETPLSGATDEQAVENWIHVLMTKTFHASAEYKTKKKINYFTIAPWSSFAGLGCQTKHIGASQVF